MGSITSKRTHVEAKLDREARQAQADLLAEARQAAMPKPRRLLYNVARDAVASAAKTAAKISEG